MVGVSGGRDSVALLHGLVTAGYQRLVVCHLDHGIRGVSAQADARFVQRLAESLKLAAVCERADVPALAKREKLSLETAARRARYEFFAAAAGRRCRTVFLAHHADDQVETFLFNLLRGAGTAGLGAMAADSERAVGRRKLRLVRPLLGVWRAEIDDYLATTRLRWRDDPTNADPAHATRNRLRLEVLPLLERTMGREVKPALWRTADILGAEADWLKQLCTTDAPLPAQLRFAFLASQPLAQQRKTIHTWLREANVAGVGYREVELIRSMLDKGHGPAKVNLPGNQHARRKAGWLFLEPSDGGAVRRATDQGTPEAETTKPLNKAPVKK